MEYLHDFEFTSVIQLPPGDAASVEIVVIPSGRVLCHQTVYEEHTAGGHQRVLDHIPEVVQMF